MKKRDDYFHLYLGSPVISKSGNRLYLSSDNLERAINEEWVLELRSLSDMTDEEETEYTSLVDQWNFGFRRNMLGAATATKYLLSKHFDLFGLIEANLCNR